MSRKRKKRLNRTTLSQLISITLIGVAIFILAGVSKQVINVYELKKQAEIAQNELTILQDENAALVTTKNKLEDENYVATYARGEYMFSKGDEKVFYLPSNSKTTSTEEETSQ